MHPLLAKTRFRDDLLGVDAELCELRGWSVHQMDYPTFEVAFHAPGGSRLRLRLDCGEWNEQPPAVLLLDSDGRPLTVVPSSSTGIFNGSAHPTTGRPFVCMRGVREYHTHPSHLNDSWDSLRGTADYRLGEIVTQIWNGWRKTNP